MYSKYERFLLRHSQCSHKDELDIASSLRRPWPQPGLRGMWPQFEKGEEKKRPRGEKSTCVVGKVFSLVDRPAAHGAKFQCCDHHHQRRLSLIEFKERKKNIEGECVCCMNIAHYHVHTIVDPPLSLPSYLFGLEIRDLGMPSLPSPLYLIPR